MVTVDGDGLGSRRPFLAKRLGWREPEHESKGHLAASREGEKSSTFQRFICLLEAPLAGSTPLVSTAEGYHSNVKVESPTVSNTNPPPKRR